MYGTERKTKRLTQMKRKMEERGDADIEGEGQEGEGEGRMGGWVDPLSSRDRIKASSTWRVLTLTLGYTAGTQ